MKHYLSTLLFFLLVPIINAWNDGSPVDLSASKISEVAEESAWVEAKYQTLSLEEKIGQLFMVRATSDGDKFREVLIQQYITNYHIGGVCFFKGKASRQVELVNLFQSLSPKVPLMVGMDAESGPASRLEGTTVKFPKALTLGAIRDDGLLYQLGGAIAEQCKRVGILVNFAPVADVNSNASNPIIGVRSFGEDRVNVASKTYHFALGLQDNGVLACAKHFPGHGDTDEDSHVSLPVIQHSKDRLDSVELFPFKVLTRHGIQSVMVGHLAMPAIDSNQKVPASLSKAAVTGILREELGFKGLVFTDGLDMRGVTRYFPAGELEAQALLAGNDVLLLPDKVPVAAQTIKSWIENGKIPESRLEDAVKRILRNKYRLGLHQWKPLEPLKSPEELATAQVKNTRRNLFQAALTLVRNKNVLIPIRRVDSSQQFSVIELGRTAPGLFADRCLSYAPLAEVDAVPQVSESQIPGLVQRYQKSKVCIVGLHGIKDSPGRSYGISEQEIKFIHELAKSRPVILVLFGSPYAVKFFENIGNTIVAYEDDPIVHDLAAQGVFGAFGMSGRLPVTASKAIPAGTGINSESLHRLSFDTPEAVGMDTDKLNAIDGLANEGIRAGAFPGCAIMVVKNGKVVYDKAFGFQTYQPKLKVHSRTRYDIASVSKVAGTTLAVMKLLDDQKIQLDKTLADYLPEAAGTDKANITLKDLLVHEAGLVPFIPFYKKTQDSLGRNLNAFYSKTKTNENDLPVAPGMFLKSNLKADMLQMILASERTSGKRYKYSDLGFILLGFVVERVSGTSLEDYLHMKIYGPLGLHQIGYSPWKSDVVHHIPPTEEDQYWRKQKVQGYVHDMTSAMLGGVSGHAGLFSTTYDLAVLMELLLNGGYYGGKRILDAETVHLFTSRCETCNRRGLGFDMKELRGSAKQYMGDKASDQTFGHLGFTGTCVWVDPKHQLTYIFLSNRTFPSMNNQRINTNDYRGRIHDVILSSILPTPVN